MTAAEPTPAAAVVLDRDRVEDLRHLLGTVEDWLLHCGDEALDDLAGFLTGLGWAPSASRESLVTDLVNDLGEHAVTLRTALQRSTEHRGGVGTGPAA